MSKTVRSAACDDVGRHSERASAFDGTRVVRTNKTAAQDAVWEPYRAHMRSASASPTSSSGGRPKCLARARIAAGDAERSPRSMREIMATLNPVARETSSSVSFRETRRVRRVFPTVFTARLSYSSYEAFDKFGKSPYRMHRERDGTMATAYETSSGESTRRALAIRHACGHEHVHAVPSAFVSDGASALSLADMLASHECPACVAGLPRWVADPAAGAAGASVQAC